METGVVLPQTEIGGDASAVRDYAQAVEDIGFTHVLAYDHVVGADPAVHPGWNGPYDVDTKFHEPLVLFGFLAGCTKRLGLVSGILILPQRQTALVAKQAAEVDLLSGGRLRLGVGIGWNHVEYESLGQDFSVRGRRLEEQAGLLRALWTNRSVTFSGRYDRIPGAGIAPLPIQRPIPIWLGGRSEAAYQRMGRIADGWFPLLGTGPELDSAIRVIAESARSAGRDPATVGMEGRITWNGDPEHVGRAAERWRASGATHISINTMGSAFATVDEHVAALAAAAGILGIRPRGN